MNVELVEFNSSVDVGGSMGSELGLEELFPIAGLKVPEVSRVRVFFFAGPSSLFNIEQYNLHNI